MSRSVSKYLTGVVTFPEDKRPGITIDQCLKMSFDHSWNGTSESSLFEGVFFESLITCSLSLTSLWSTPVNI